MSIVFATGYDDGLLWGRTLGPATTWMGAKQNNGSWPSAPKPRDLAQSSHPGCSGRQNSAAASTTVEAVQSRLRQCMKVQIESDQRGRCRTVFRVGQLVDIHGKDGDLIVMWLVAGRRTRAAVTADPKIGAALNSAASYRGFLYTARVFWKRRRAWRNIEDNPVPPAAASWRIRIIHRDRETFRATRRSTPSQCGRHVAACAAEPLEHLFVRNCAALCNLGAG